MRILVLVSLAVCVAAAALVTIVWWIQPVAVFFGRRAVAWDAVDFGPMYSAAHLVASGDGHRLFDIDALVGVQRAHTPLAGNLRHPYLNPPFFALVLAPLSHLSFGRAYQTWTGISVALLGSPAGWCGARRRPCRRGSACA